MNYFAGRFQTPVEGQPWVREDAIFVDSRGEVTHTTRYAVPCPQGEHLLEVAGPCRECERAWWRSQGRILGIDGWVNSALKVPNEERPVLLKQGWTVQKITATYTHMEPPAGDEDVLIPLCEPEDIPRDVRQRLALSEVPALPSSERRVLTRLSRKGLMAYKRLVPSFKRLDEHLEYLSTGALVTSPRKSGHED